MASKFGSLCAEDFTIALSIILDAVGNAMSSGKKVDIDFGGVVGHLQCDGSSSRRPTFIQATHEMEGTVGSNLGGGKSKKVYFSSGGHSPRHDVVARNIRKPGD